MTIGIVLAAASAHAQPERISFLDAVRRGERQNPDAQVAMQEIARARAVVEEVRSGSFPILNSYTTYTRLDSPRISEVNKSSIITPQSQLQTGGTAVLTLAPQRWVQWRQARENEQVVTLDAAQVRRAVTISIAQVYLALITQHRLVDANAVAVQNAQAHVEYTQARLDAGGGTVLDRQRATAVLEADRTQLENARYAVVRLQEQLGILLGENRPLDVMAELNLPPLPADATLALEEAERWRADLRLSREQLTFAKQVLHDSWADYMPYLVTSFDLFYQTPPTQVYPTTGWQLLLTLNFPIYDGGLRYGLLKERRAVERESLIRLEAVLRLVRADVRLAAAELSYARAALISAREAARLWADSLRLTLVGYRSGLLTDIEVIDAQSAALNADIAAAIAENNERQAELDLLLASGRLP